VSALATSSVVVPILMNSEQPFGISAAAAAPIAERTVSVEAVPRGMKDREKIDLAQSELQHSMRYYLL